MSKTSSWVLVLIGCFLVVAFAMNPSYDDFEHQLKSNFKAGIGVQEGRGVLDAVTGFVVDSVSLKQFVRYRDFKFFSIYYVQLPGRERETYIGAFCSFARL